MIDQEQLLTLSPYPFELEHNGIMEINPAPMWLSLLKDLQRPQPKARIASRFPLCLSQIIATVVERISAQHGIKTVALSGGVFQNPTLLLLTLNELRSKRFVVLTHRQVPSNDGGLSLGQAMIAAATTPERE